MNGNLPLLLLSVLLSSGRNILSKRIALGGREKTSFFLSQGVLFTTATLLLASCQSLTEASLSPTALWLGLLYGMLLLSSQWLYTLALQGGSTAVCSTVYALGFLLPTLSGVLFWEEAFTLTDGIGLILALVIILLSARKDEPKQQNANRFLPFLLVAMLSSGGLGILQKVQQTSAAAEQSGHFLLVAFSLAAVCSLVAFFTCRQPLRICKTNTLYPALAGLCFGGANLCNTLLAGRMRSAAFFPLQNISTILLSVVLGIILFRERLNRRTIVIILLGVAVVLLFSR
ncbi:MAG: hypothetical protein IJO76_07595 [Clostridia bacterium]|nr:hypothetical protein [Clostridia bacterium]